MRQKTQLACALIRPAVLLLLDEPVVGLDPPSQALLHELLLERKAGGCAVLLTTHQLGFAEGLADRGMLLSEGETIDAGSYRDVADNAAEGGWEIA
jgi:ABC-type multidrug transport system ATPase subunit